MNTVSFLSNRSPCTQCLLSKMLWLVSIQMNTEGNGCERRVVGHLHTGYSFVPGIAVVKIKLDSLFDRQQNVNARGSPAGIEHLCS